MPPRWDEWGDRATLLESKEWLQIFTCYSCALFAIPNAKNATLLLLFFACLSILEGPNKGQ